MNLDQSNLRCTGDPHSPDYVASAVLHALARPNYPKLSWGLIRTIVLGIISFGVLPILIWTKRFRQFVTVEQQQFWHLAEWLRLNSKEPAAAQLRADADGLGVQTDLRLLTALCLAFLGIIFFTQLLPFRFHRWDALLDCTYLYPFYHMRPGKYHDASSSLAFRLFNTWTLALSAAYVFHWMQVQLHAKAVGRFIGRFNTITAAEGLTRVQAQFPGAGFRPLWIVAAAVFALSGSLWGVPMMLAGAAQRRLVRHASTINRAAMAHRLRAMLLARHPNEEIAMPIYLRRLCTNDRCRAAVHESASFCPRCGSRIVPSLHRVA